MFNLLRFIAGTQKFKIPVILWEFSTLLMKPLVTTGALDSSSVGLEWSYKAHYMLSKPCRLFIPYPKHTKLSLLSRSPHIFVRTCPCNFLASLIHTTRFWWERAFRKCYRSKNFMKLPLFANKSLCQINEITEELHTSLQRG